MASSPPIVLPAPFYVARVLAIVEGWIMATLGWGFGIAGLLLSISSTEGWGRAILFALAILVIGGFGVPGLTYLIVSRFMKRVRLWPAIALTALPALQLMVGLWVMLQIHRIDAALFLFYALYIGAHVAMLIVAIVCLRSYRRYVPIGAGFEPILKIADAP